MNLEQAIIFTSTGLMIGFVWGCVTGYIIMLKRRINKMPTNELLYLNEVIDREIDSRQDR